MSRNPRAPALLLLLALPVAALAQPPARPPAGGVPLRETTWWLVEMGGQAVAAGATSREPHLVLAAEGHRVEGSGGCNRFSGTFELAGERLRFGPLMMTRMACEPGVDEQESAFVRALGATTRYRLLGGTLELRDEQGLVLVRFEARPGRANQPRRRRRAGPLGPPRGPGPGRAGPG